MKTYPVLDRIEHNDKRYEVGSTVEMTEEEAEALPFGVLGEPLKNEKAAKKETQPV
jgi:hypothetical protein